MRRRSSGNDDHRGHRSSEKVGHSYSHKPISEEGWSNPSLDKDNRCRRRSRKNDHRYQQPAEDSHWCNYSCDTCSGHPTLPDQELLYYPTTPEERRGWPAAEPSRGYSVCPNAGYPEEWLGNYPIDNNHSQGYWMPTDPAQAYWWEEQLRGHPMAEGGPMPVPRHVYAGNWGPEPCDENGWPQTFGDECYPKQRSRRRKSRRRKKSAPDVHSQGPSTGINRRNQELCEEQPSQESVYDEEQQEDYSEEEKEAAPRPPRSSESERRRHHSSNGHRKHRPKQSVEDDSSSGNSSSKDDEQESWQPAEEPWKPRCRHHSSKKSSSHKSEEPKATSTDEESSENKSGRRRKKKSEEEQMREFWKTYYKKCQPTAVEPSWQLGRAAVPIEVKTKVMQKIIQSHQKPRRRR